MVVQILLAAALLLFVASALGAKLPPFNLQSAGLACLAAALLVGSGAFG